MFIGKENKEINILFFCFLSKEMRIYRLFALLAKDLT